MRLITRITGFKTLRMNNGHNTNNCYISKDEYVNRYLRHAIPYEGFVCGIGYAFPQYNMISPTTHNPSGKMFWDMSPQTLLVQAIESSDYMRERSWNVSSEDITQLIMRTNLHGETIVNLGHGKEIIIPKNAKHQIKIDVTDTGSQINVSVSVTIEDENGIKSATTKCRLIDFSSVFQPTLFSPSALEVSKDFQGISSIAQKTTEIWWKNLSNQKQNKYIYDAKKVLKNNNFRIKSRTQDIRRAMPKKLKTVGKRIGWLGVGISIWSATDDGKITVGDVADLVMAGVSFIPVYGWIIGGVYFIGDIIIEEVTDRSIKEWIDTGIGKDAVIMDDITDLFNIRFIF